MADPREDVYVLAAVLADLDRVLHPLPLEMGDGVRVNPGFNPLLPEAGASGSVARSPGSPSSRTAPLGGAPRLRDRPRTVSETPLRVRRPVEHVEPPAPRLTPPRPGSHAGELDEPAVMPVEVELPGEREPRRPGPAQPGDARREKGDESVERSGAPAVHHEPIERVRLDASPAREAAAETRLPAPGPDGRRDPERFEEVSPASMQSEDSSARDSRPTDSAARATVLPPGLPEPGTLQGEAARRTVSRDRESWASISIPRQENPEGPNRSRGPVAEEHRLAPPAAGPDDDSGDAGVSFREPHGRVVSSDRGRPIGRESVSPAAVSREPHASSQWTPLVESRGGLPGLDLLRLSPPVEGTSDARRPGELRLERDSGTVHGPRPLLGVDDPFRARPMPPPLVDPVAWRAGSDRASPPGAAAAAPEVLVGSDLEPEAEGDFWDSEWPLEVRRRTLRLSGRSWSLTAQEASKLTRNVRSRYLDRALRRVR